MTEARRASSLPREGCKQMALRQGTLAGKAGSLLSHKSMVATRHAFDMPCLPCGASVCLAGPFADKCLGLVRFSILRCCCRLCFCQRMRIPLSRSVVVRRLIGRTVALVGWAFVKQGFVKPGLCQTRCRQTGLRQTISFLFRRMVLLSHGVVVGCGPVLGGAALVQSATLWHGTGIHNSPGGKRR